MYVMSACGAWKGPLKLLNVVQIMFCFCNKWSIKSNNFIPYKIVKINQAIYCLFSCSVNFFYFFPLSLSTIWSAESFFDRFFRFLVFYFININLFFPFLFWCLNFDFFGDFGGFIFVLISTFTFVFPLFFSFCFSVSRRTICNFFCCFFCCCFA